MYWQDSEPSRPTKRPSLRTTNYIISYLYAMIPSCISVICRRTCDFTSRRRSRGFSNATEAVRQIVQGGPSGNLLCLEIGPCDTDQSFLLLHTSWGLPSSRWTCSPSWQRSKDSRQSVTGIAPSVMLRCVHVLSLMIHVPTNSSGHAACVGDLLHGIRFHTSRY